MCAGIGLHWARRDKDPRAETGAKALGDCSFAKVERLGNRLVGHSRIRAQQLHDPEIEVTETLGRGGGRMGSNEAVEVHFYKLSR